jgi:basic amino acid/polyamine antiporter, APA family
LAPGSAIALPAAATLDAIWSGAFAQSLIYVSYAYSGWNAAAYVADEVHEPQQTLPRAMVLGTLLVTGLYLLLNLTFLATTSLGELAGTVEVGALAARRILGPGGGLLLTLALALLLVSSISSMALAGPRVLQAIGEDLPSLSTLARRNRRGAPTRAVLAQQALALGLVFTDAFEAVLTFAGFTLTLFAFLTVAGVFRLRRLEPRLPRPFRVPLYPLPPLIFLVVSGASLAAVAWERPATAGMVSGLLLAAGWLIARARTHAD